MAKKKYVVPMLMNSTEPGDDVVIGGGTGQSTTDPYPCTYAEWAVVFGGDDDLDETPGTFDDYKAWWEDNLFSQEDWEKFNP